MQTQTKQGTTGVLFSLRTEDIHTTSTASEASGLNAATNIHAGPTHYCQRQSREETLACCDENGYDLDIQTDKTWGTPYTYWCTKKGVDVGTGDWDE